MSYELDQLRAELAYMEKCGGMEQSIRIVRERIAKIESEMSDPWWEAKSQVDAIMLQRNETTWQRKVAEYVLHLEDELAALKAKSQEVPPLIYGRFIATIVSCFESKVDDPGGLSHEYLHFANIIVNAVRGFYGSPDLEPYKIK